MSMKTVLIKSKRTNMPPKTAIIKGRNGRLKAQETAKKPGMKHTTGKRQPIKISLKNIDLAKKYRDDISKIHTMLKIVPNILRKSRNMLYFQRTIEKL